MKKYILLIIFSGFFYLLAETNAISKDLEFGFEIISNNDKEPSQERSFEVEFLESKNENSTIRIQIFSGNRYQESNIPSEKFFRVREIGLYNSRGFWSELHETQEFIQDLKQNHKKISITSNEETQPKVTSKNQTDSIFQLIEIKGKKTLFLNSKEIKIEPQQKTNRPAEVYYRINNGNWLKLSKGFLEFSLDGRYTLDYYSEDILGNKEDINTVEFLVDNTPPNTELKIETHTNSYGESFVSLQSKIQLIANDNLSGLGNTYFRTFCNLNEKGNFQIYLSELYVENLISNCEKEIFLEYFSIDLAGNQEKVKLFILKK